MATLLPYRRGARVTRKGRTMRSEWSSQCGHRTTEDRSRKEPESSSSGISTTHYTLPSVYCLRRRLLRHHSSQTEEEPCTETDSTLGSSGSPLQRYPRHGESCLTGDHTDPDPEASSAAPRDLAHSRDVRTSDLDSSVVSSSSTSVRWTTAYPTSDFRRTLHYDSHPQRTDKPRSPATRKSRDPAAAGDTGYGETSSSEEQDSSWSRSSGRSSSSSSSSSSSGTTTASGALASVSDNRDDTDEEDRVDVRGDLGSNTEGAPFSWPPTSIHQAKLQDQEEVRETDPDTELVTSEQISSTDAEDTRSVGTEEVSEVTTASESRIDDDKAHAHYEPDVAAGTSQASAEACVEATTEGETKAEAQAVPDTCSRSQGDAEGDQSSEAGPSSAPMYLRPTIEIDTSDILHKAKPEIDEGDFGVGPSYKKMTEAEFVAQLSIHEAARTGDLHVIKLLLKSDSKRMETVDERGWTPIHLAAANGQSEVVRYLALEGADVAALDPTSYTAMHLAAMNGHNSCLEVLLKVGADVDNITADGFTPLHLAALNNYADCVRTLLSWGANLAIEDALGRTVQDMVEEYALDDVSTLLSGLWTHIDKYRQSGKQNGQSGNSRKRSTRKLVQMAASSMGQD
ncbi:hypothetical protein HPB47_010236 [Ixodes persulcatus]|uniref:Uncharacterized protein n=1 Tax=Ixodes persulcatus TaxID=34615 RepID=A0AC60NZR9_IXOPE|nr:hypothetical protein HPB47_010236 [Ixodes persulcatus]